MYLVCVVMVAGPDFVARCFFGVIVLGGVCRRTSGFGDV